MASEQASEQAEFDHTAVDCSRKKAAASTPNGKRKALLCLSPNSSNTKRNTLFSSTNGDAPTSTVGEIASGDARTASAVGGIAAQPTIAKEYPFLPHSKFFHSGSVELMQELETRECIYFSLHEVDVAEAKTFLEKAATHDVWKVFFDEADSTGKRVSTGYKSVKFLASTADDPTSETYYSIVEKLRDAASTPNICLLKNAYAHMMDPTGKGGMKRHGDHLVFGQEMRSLLTEGESEKGKLLEIVEVDATGGALKDGRLVRYMIPHGTMYTFTKEGSGSNWRSGTVKAGELTVAHRPINAQRCVSLVMEYRPNCMKNVPAKHAIAVMHGALEQVRIGNNPVAFGPPILLRYPNESQVTTEDDYAEKASRHALIQSLTLHDDEFVERYGHLGFSLEAPTGMPPLTPTQCWCSRCQKAITWRTSATGKNPKGEAATRNIENHIRSMHSSEKEDVVQHETPSHTQKLEALTGEFASDMLEKTGVPYQIYCKVCHTVISCAPYTSMKECDFRSHAKNKCTRHCKGKTHQKRLAEFNKK
jgi:hypothetical protein